MKSCGFCDALYDYEEFFEHGLPMLYLCKCGSVLSQDGAVLPTADVDLSGVSGRGLFIDASRYRPKTNKVEVTHVRLGSLASVLDAVVANAEFKFRSKAEAIAANRCIKCGLDVTDRNKTDACKREYLISGIDGICYDAMFEEDEKC